MSKSMLSSALQGKMSLYTALAASASITAVASADVQYSGIQNVPVDNTAPVRIDVTGDGFDNLIFSVDAALMGGAPLVQLYSSTGSDFFLAYNSPVGYPYAVNFDAGALINDAAVDILAGGFNDNGTPDDPSDDTTNSATLVYANVGAFQSPDDSGYIGLKLPVFEDIDDPGTPEIDPTTTFTGFVFGYAQVANVTGSSLTVVDWAFEDGVTSEGEPLGIVTGATSSVPEPGSLGALAIGALALVRRNKRRIA